MNKKSKSKVRRVLKHVGKARQLPKALPAVAKAVPQRFKRKNREERTREAIQTLPRITNETVAEHREEVLGSARKYIYPLQHSKHRIVIISSTLLVLAVIAFFVYSGLALYKFQSSNAFIYRVTQVLPFPVAKAGGSWVAYENYLFQLRRFEHYYESQQRVDFSSKDGKQQLDRYKPQALQQVIDDAYVKQLAAKHHVSVSGREVDAAIASFRAQNQLGNSNQELADVANQFFGWSIDDLKRELKQEILTEKVAATLDTNAQSQAQTALSQVKSGVDFGQVAKQLSQDAATKDNGGQYGDTAITAASTDIPAPVVQALEQLQPGQFSDIIVTDRSLEIVKLISRTDGKMTAAHISIPYKPISADLPAYKAQHHQHAFISVK